MKSANALLYLSPQYENFQGMTSAYPINEEEEYNTNANHHHANNVINTGGLGGGGSGVDNENDRSVGFVMDD